jgi:phosphate transport system protein
MLEGHISKAFDGDLATLHLRVLALGGLVLDQVHEAARAYGEWDAHAAERVIQRNPSVDVYHSEISDLQITLIARRQPVASDLRAIVALAKAADEIEHAADAAHKLARAVLQQPGRPGRRTASDVRHVARLAENLLRATLEALDRIDGSLASEVIARDEELDTEYDAGMRRLMSRAMEDPRNFEVALEAAFVLKALERIGDHAVNIAQQVLNIVPNAPRTGSPRVPTSTPPGAPSEPPAASEPPAGPATS